MSCVILARIWCKQMVPKEIICSTTSKQFLMKYESQSNWVFSLYISEWLKKGLASDINTMTMFIYYELCNSDNDLVMTKVGITLIIRHKVGIYTTLRDYLIACLHIFINIYMKSSCPESWPLHDLNVIFNDWRVRDLAFIYTLILAFDWYSICSWCSVLVIGFA